MFEEIFSIDDERVGSYANLKDRDLRREGIFICEGRFLVERLIDSGWPVGSVLIEKRCVAEFEEKLRANPGWNFPVYFADSEVLSSIVGFDFHRGVLACGIRPEGASVAKMTGEFENKMRLTFVVCPEVNNLENLGAIFRTSAALGVDAILLGERCCDPLSRRVVRVSMGTVFSVPFMQSRDLKSDLLELKERLGVQIWSAVLDEKAELLSEIQRTERVALMFGNEADGLSSRWLEISDKLVTIPMENGTDSLNLSVAAGIFIYSVL